MRGEATGNEEIWPDGGQATSADGEVSRRAGCQVLPIASVARSLSDPSRLRILRTLTDGRAYSATMLAMEAGIVTSTASAHLGQLVEAGLVRRATPPREGRYRYYALAGHEVAEVYEALSTLAPAGAAAGV